MTTDEIVKLGTLLGLKFNMKTNYADAFEKGRVVFDGANGQRFSIETQWGYDEIIKSLGEALIQMGKRMKNMEIKHVMSIN